MRNISSAFLRALTADERDYKCRLVITLANNTVINVNNSRIWDNGFQIEDAVSADNMFQIGGAIINAGKFILNNIYGDFDAYSFDGASVVAYVGLDNLDNGTSEEIKLGTFIVDEPTYNGSLITLDCVDNMSKFDKVYSTNLVYPTTLYEIVSDACTKCGVTLDNSSLNFPHKDYAVTNKPSGDNTTYRQVISWAAQIAGCFARCNSDGKLEVKWYNTGELDSIALGLDGGVFDKGSVDALSAYYDTEDGMTTISSAPVDDAWFLISNSIGFIFNGSVYSYICLTSNSGLCFANEQPTGSTISNNSFNIKICNRDGSSESIKYQQITIGSVNVLKIRFNGHTRYGSNRAEDNELVYEIFFTSLGEIIINYITLPTDATYQGVSGIIENNVTTELTPSIDEIVSLVRGSNNTWVEGESDAPYISGDNADGGTFNPWSDSDEYDGGTFSDLAGVHFINSSYSSNISTDDVVITGVKVVKKIKEDGADSFIEYSSGTAGYVVSVENNELIDGEHGQDVATWLGTLLIGLSFRKAELEHPNNPSIEAGDVAFYFDTNDNFYPIIVSSTTFVVGGSQTTKSSAETPRKNSAQMFSESTRNYVELRKRLSEQKTAWEDAASALGNRIDNASGLYCTEVQSSGTTIKYYHDKSDLDESNIVMMFSDVGFTLTDNYQDENPTWYGMTVDGTMIAAILNANGVNADWINSGALTIKDSNDREIFYANATTGIVRITGYNSSNAKTFEFDSSTGSLILRGSISVGGSNNVNGVIEIYNSSNTRVGRWDNSKLYLGNIGSSLENPTLEIATNGDIISYYRSQYLNLKTLLTAGVIKSLTGSTFQYTSFVLDNNGLTFKNDYSTTNSVYIDHSGSIRVNNTSGTSVVEMYRSTSGNGCLKLNNLIVSDIKSKSVNTDYGERLAYCYEMPTPMYGDIGSAMIGDDGSVMVDIDPIFRDYIFDRGEYYIFLQNEGVGESYVSKKTPTYFVISGTAGLKVAWELKARQADIHWMRSESFTEEPSRNDEEIDYEEQAFADVMNFLNAEVME